MVNRLEKRELVLHLHRSWEERYGPLTEKAAKLASTKNLTYCQTEFGTVFESGFSSRSCPLGYRHNHLFSVGEITPAMLPLHPGINLSTVQRILNDQIPDNLRNTYNQFLAGVPGYTLRLLNTIKLDGTPQGIPVTNIYASSQEKSSTAAADSPCMSRFDWVEINIDNVVDNAFSTDYAQVCGILDFKDPINADSTFLIIVMRTRKIAKTGPRKLDPFPNFKYDQDCYHLQHVESILRPAFVIPVSCTRSSLIEPFWNERKHVLFTAIPYAFFYRDDWDNLDKGLTWSETEVSMGENRRALKYKTTLQERDAMTALCISVLDMPNPTDNEEAEYLIDTFVNNIDNNNFNDADFDEYMDNRDELEYEEGIDENELRMLQSMA